MFKYEIDKTRLIRMVFHNGHPNSCDEKVEFLLFNLHLLSTPVPKLYKTCL